MIYMDGHSITVGPITIIADMAIVFVCCDTRPLGVGECRGHPNKR